MFSLEQVMEVGENKAAGRHVSSNTFGKWLGKWFGRAQVFFYETKKYFIVGLKVSLLLQITVHQAGMSFVC